MNDLENFKALGVAGEILTALENKGFTEPTPIQKLAIPLLFSGEKDVIGQAQTGTGKTAAFGIPILQTLSHDANGIPHALILSPTRELSIQIAGELESLRGPKPLAIGAFYGGQPIEIQLKALRRGMDVVIGTPGRILDLMRRKRMPLGELEFAVLDEADEMLDMGFIDDIREILSETNPGKRMLMFSATMPEEIRKIAEEFMRPGYEIARTVSAATNVELTSQIRYEVRREQKIDALCRLIDAIPDLYAMVFCRTRADVDQVAEELQKRNRRVEPLHGELSQAQRLKVIDGFKAKKFPVLIATDVAARGIDVNDLTHVINFSMPQNPETYIHRIGRTGRAGQHGTAITFVTPGETRKIAAIERAIALKIEEKQLPSPEEIVEAGKQKFASAVADMLQNQSGGDYRNFAEELLTLGDHPAEVLSCVLKCHFRNALLAESYAPISVKRAPEEMTKLVLFRGRRDGLTLPELLAAISDRTGIRSAALGKIILRADRTFLSAVPADAERILKGFRHDPEWEFKPPKTHGGKEGSGPGRQTGKERTVKNPPRKPLRERFQEWVAEEENRFPARADAPSAPKHRKKSRRPRE